MKKGILILFIAVSFLLCHTNMELIKGSGRGGDVVYASEEGHGGETHAHHEGEGSSGHHRGEGTTSSLPLWAILIPLLGAFAVLGVSESDDRRNAIVVGSTTVSFFLLIVMYRSVLHGGVRYAIDYLPGFSLTFNVDPAGLVVALVISFLWVVSSIYAITYMTHEGHRTRYDFFVLATLAANIGVILAGDFLTLFIFFEGLIMFPYALIAHVEDKPAMDGANQYLYIGVVTSLSLLMGIVLLYYLTGSVAIRPLAGAIEKGALSANMRYLLAGLMIFGFGGKAGIFLEHIWLPKAHPVAPTPASALLSGAMIKAGAYGIFRVVNMLFVPAEWTGYAEQWLTMSNIGYVVIWIGIITMFLAVLSALITANSKRMLAFHSVSQMGYIVMGIGCAAYMGSEGAMGLSGAIYHIVNHALFKASLFLCVGAVYFRTHELDMYKLGGLWKNMPFVAIGLFIAVCGISGLPFFNGFASKTLLHHAIVESYEYSVHTGNPDKWLRLAEVIFVITAAGTFTSNMKLFVLTFLRRRPEKYKEVEPAPFPMRIAVGLLSAAILLIGIFPNWLLNTFIGPALSYFNFNPSSHAYHLIYDIHANRSGIAILYPNSESFASVVHNLLGTGGVLIIAGGIMFILGFRYGWFHIEVPEWLTLEYHYKNIFIGFREFCREPVSLISDLIDEAVTLCMVYLWLPVSHTKSLYRRFDEKAVAVIGGEPVVDRYLAGRYINCCGNAGEIDLDIVDGTIVDSGRFVRHLSTVWRKIQTGGVQNYLLLMTLGLVVIVSIYMCIMCK